MEQHGHEMPNIRPTMGYNKRINVDHIVNDPKNIQYAFKVVNNEAGQMQRHLSVGWKVWQEEEIVDYTFDESDADSQENANRVRRGALCFPVGTAKSDKPIDAYLLYIGRAIYAHNLKMMDAEAQAQIDMVNNGQVQDSKGQALQAAIGGAPVTARTTEFSVDRGIAST